MIFSEQSSNFLDENFKPIKKNILVKMDLPEDEVSEGGIIMVRPADKHIPSAFFGTVLRVGEDTSLVSVNDKVVIGKRRGLLGAAYLVIDEKDIDAVVTS
jgi:co-chaperonin GroES (HSP10)